MSRSWAWFALLRPFNLVLVALTPFALWVALVHPVAGAPQVEPVLTPLQVLWLGIAIALVAGAGNVVNDISDRTIDELNGRPNPLLAGVPVGGAWALYVGLNLVALGISYALARETDRLWALLAWPAAVGLLLVYSLALKCVPLLGNAAVALLCAAVPGFLLVAEPSLLDALPGAATSHALLAYCLFAFAGTMARELVKDLQDREGDRQAGCRTLAVRWPQGRLHELILGFGFVSLVAVGYLAAVYYRASAPVAAVAWLSVWACLALTLLGIRSTRGTEVSDYGRVSRHLKWTIALALLVLMVYGRGA